MKSREERTPFTAGALEQLNATINENLHPDGKLYHRVVFIHDDIGENGETTFIAQGEASPQTMIAAMVTFAQSITKDTLMAFPEFVNALRHEELSLASLFTDAANAGAMRAVKEALSGSDSDEDTETETDKEFRRVLFKVLNEDGDDDDSGNNAAPDSGSFHSPVIQ